MSRPRPTWNQSRARLFAWVGLTWAFIAAWLSVGPISVEISTLAGESLVPAHWGFASVIAGFVPGVLFAYHYHSRRFDWGVLPLSSLVSGALFGVMLWSFHALAGGSSMPGTLSIVALFFYSLSLGVFAQTAAEGTLAASDSRSRTLSLLVITMPIIAGGALFLGGAASFSWWLGFAAVILPTVIAAAGALAFPIATLRTLAALIIFLGYRPAIQHIDRIPDEGPVLIASNHVSYLDFVLLMAIIRRPHRFVIWHSFLDIPVFGLLARRYGCIPIHSDPKERKMIIAAFRQIGDAFKGGEAIILFPEGALPYSPEIQPFMRGVDVILKRDAVPVVPLAISGLWGSPYSRKGGQSFRSIRGPWRRIWVDVGDVMPPGQANRENLEETIKSMWSARPNKP